MQLNPRDNVRVDLKNGHKYALCDIAAGENVIKYGFPIGHATRAIAKGEHVHSHNLATNLSGEMEYTYAPVPAPLPGEGSKITIGTFAFAKRNVQIQPDVHQGRVTAYTSPLVQVSRAVPLESSPR